MIRGVRLFLLCGIVAGTGCGGEFDSRATVPRWDGSVDTRDGVQLVINSSSPMLPSGLVETAELWSHSLEGKLEERQTWESTPLVEVRNESAYLLAPRAGNILVFDTESGGLDRVISLWADEGGHLHDPVGMAALEDALMVGERHEIKVFGADGTFVRQVAPPVRDSQLDQISRLHGLDSISAITLESAGGAPVWRRYKPSGGPESYPRPHGMSRYYPTATEKRCWRISGGPTGLLLGSCFFPVVLQLDSLGEVFREVVIEGGGDSTSRSEMRPLRRESRARWKELYPRMDEEGVERRVERDVRLHQLKDHYRDLEFDPATGLYSFLVETPEYMGGGDAELHLFSGAGIFVASIEFSEYWLDHDVRDSVVYALARDGRGLTWLRSYRLTLPAEALNARPDDSGKSGTGGEDTPTGNG